MYKVAQQKAKTCKRKKKQNKKVTASKNYVKTQTALQLSPPVSSSRATRYIQTAIVCLFLVSYVFAYLSTNLPETLYLPDLSDFLLLMQQFNNCIVSAALKAKTNKEKSKKTVRNRSK